MIYGDVWKGTRGGGLSGTRNSLGGCLSVFSPEARLPNALPLPAPLSPWASIILFFLIYSHCSRQTKEQEQWWSLGC